MRAAFFLLLALPLVMGARILSVDHDDTDDDDDRRDHVRLLDSDTGTATPFALLSDADRRILDLYHDTDHDQTIILDRTAITTLDKDGFILSKVMQPYDATVVALGYNRNTTQLFGIVEGIKNDITLAMIDRNDGTLTHLASANATGSVKTAYYAWSKGHFCVIVAPPAGPAAAAAAAAAADTMLFFDTTTLDGWWQSDVQPGFDIRAVAINFVTENVYVLAAVNGSMWFAISHMSGQLQTALTALPDGATITHGNAAVVDNAANVAYCAVDVAGKPTLLVFDLAQNGTMVAHDLAHESSALSLTIAQ